MTGDTFPSPGDDASLPRRASNIGCTPERVSFLTERERNMDKQAKEGRREGGEGICSEQDRKLKSGDLIQRTADTDSCRPTSDLICFH